MKWGPCTCRTKKHVGMFSGVSLYVALWYVHITRSVQRSVLVHACTKQTEQTRAICTCKYLDPVSKPPKIAPTKLHYKKMLIAPKIFFKVVPSCEETSFNHLLWSVFQSSYIVGCLHSFTARGFSSRDPTRV